MPEPAGLGRLDSNLERPGWEIREDRPTSGLALFLTVLRLDEPDFLAGVRLSTRILVLVDGSSRTTCATAEPVRMHMVFLEKFLKITADLPE